MPPLSEPSPIGLFMRHAASFLVVSAVTVLACSTLLACDETNVRGTRVVGETCQASNDCAQGICGAGQCLDPAIDSDSDGLLNVVEASLKTNPTEQDTDADGKLDFDEVVDITAPRDSDGDGEIDALESALRDSDGDCLVDELDSLTNKAETDLDVLAESVCCCDGACSEVEPETAYTATCTGGELILINCGTSADCALGQHCEAPPGRGRCTTIPLMATMDGDPLCNVDGDCDTGQVCFAFELRGTCVLPNGDPPVMPPSLRCQRPELGESFVPDCRELISEF
ncbi:MAG: hypothetical protein ACI9MR_004494 [Myxococcota bacterium]|jgi:hypothetical protein